MSTNFIPAASDMLVQFGIEHAPAACQEEARAVTISASRRPQTATGPTHER
ncbi:MAG: hypothetical protein ABI790_17645 [Betaproteobacteria bacterium]